MTPYQATLKTMRKDARKSLTALKRTYYSLPDQDSWYARQVFAILKVQQQVCEIYDNAPDAVEDTE
jgi:histone deacetylase complex regulatory component SIN3